MMKKSKEVISPGEIVDKSNWFQTVTLVLANGRKCHYSGKAQLDTDLSPEDRNVVDILVTKPAPLPEGQYWQENTEPILLPEPESEEE